MGVKAEAVAFYTLALKDLKPSLACQKRILLQITLFSLLILPQLAGATSQIQILSTGPKP